MSEQNAQYVRLQQTMTDEFFRIAGLPPTGILRRLLGPLIWLPTRRFAKLAVDFDNEIAQYGMNEAAARYLMNYTNGSQVHGAEKIPKDGPLIITSNHPGTFDLFTVLSSTARDDFKFIISGVPVVRSLPAAANYLIYTTSDPHGRMNVVRTATRHVREGGSLVLFPTGILDPDPEIIPGAYEALGIWSRSIELILRRVPEALVQVAIVSGVLPPSAMRTPLTRLVKEKWKKQRLAEFILVARHLVSNKKFDVEPKLSYGDPVSVKELRNDADSTSLTDAIIKQARVQLSNHTQIFPGYE